MYEQTLRRLTLVCAQGCRELLSDWLHENVVTVVGMDISLMVAQVRRPDADAPRAPAVILRLPSSCASRQVLQLALALQLWRTFRRRETVRTTRQMDDADSVQGSSNDADSAYQIIQ